jgi:hypothetical protein
MRKPGLNQFDLYALFNRFDEALADWAEENAEPKPDANEFMLVALMVDDKECFAKFQHMESSTVLTFDLKNREIVQ